MRHLLAALLLFASSAFAADNVTVCQYAGGFTNTGDTDHNVTTCVAVCACDWSTCVGSDSGLNAIRLVINQAGVTIRWNTDTTVDAVLVGMMGAGMVTTIQRTSSGDTTEWFDLESDNIRLVDMTWVDSNVTAYGLDDAGFPAGWLTRTTTAASDFTTLSRRPATALQWIHDSLNPADKPLGWAGTSTAGNAVMGCFMDPAAFPVVRKLDWLFLAGAMPWYRFSAQCNASTPAGTSVNPATGALGDGNAGVARLDLTDWKGIVDYVHCQTAQNCFNSTQAANIAGDFFLTLPTCTANRYTGQLIAHVDTENSLNRSDNDVGCTWSMGQLYNHAVMGAANRSWQECTQGRHGQSIIDISDECFTEFFNDAATWINSVQ
jgi:hypothetical protein